MIRSNRRENVNRFNHPQSSFVNQVNGPIPRPNTQESFYAPGLNCIAPTFKGGQGYPNGNFQDPTSMGQHRRVNNPVFKTDHMGVGV